MVWGRFSLDMNWDTTLEAQFSGSDCASESLITCTSPLASVVVLDCPINLVTAWTHDSGDVILDTSNSGRSSDSTASSLTPISSASFFQSLTCDDSRTSRHSFRCFCLTDTVNWTKWVSVTYFCHAISDCFTPFASVEVGHG